MSGRDLNEQLSDLRDAILRFGEDVAMQLRDAISALANRDVVLASRVIEGDDEINARFFTLERTCIELLALQQPVAGDLRFVVASFKILTDLERIADLAANVSELTRELERDVRVVRVPNVDVHALATFAAEMVDDALMAYATGDPDACAELADRDGRLDDRCDRATATLVRNLVEHVPAEDRQQPLLDAVRHLLLLIHDVERVGDHAANIAGRTFYMATGDATLIY